MKKNICKVLSSLIFVSLFLTGCSDGNQTSETSSQEITIEKESSTQHSVKKKEVVRATPEPIPEDEYYSILKEFYETLSSGTELSEEWGNQVLKLWKNILDEEDDPETDPFAKENGNFVDLDTAFQSFYRKHYDLSQEILSLIDKSEKMAYRLESSNPPTPYADLQKEALETYGFCAQLMDTVIYYLDSYEKTKVLFELDLKRSKQLLETFSEDLKNAPSKTTESVQKSESNYLNTSSTISSQSTKSFDPVASYLKRYINLTPQDLKFDSSGVGYYQDFRFSQDANVSGNPLDGGLFYDRLVFLVNESVPELYKAAYGKYFTRASKFTVNDLEAMVPTLKQIFQNDMLTQKRIIDYLNRAGSECIEITSQNLEDPLAATYDITIKDGASLGEKLDLPDQTVAFLLAKLKDYGATYTFNSDSIVIQRSSYK